MESNIPMTKGTSHPLLSHLAMSLAPGGSSTIHYESQMKVLLWNCCGCNSLDFQRNFRAIVAWNNPTIICLTETKMANHYPLMHAVGFTDMFDIAAEGYSDGVVFMWKSDELSMDPVAVTDQEIHVNVQVSPKSDAAGTS
ncbi:uncharacterized protein LOC132054801 [Lycium ferocissimum]|uniref:uncharacterized protein LOC132054801 n=1 Tax=Lycium ferocissimum TaxID=112874 RepID=UPI002814A2BB|nr:uncharacterized protein LOC132054801 [Lycium ferocissimum]